MKMCGFRVGSLDWLCNEKEKMMKVTLIIDGNTYESKETDEFTHEEASEMFYENAGSMDCFKLELENGDKLVLGKLATQRCQLIFHA